MKVVQVLMFFGFVSLIHAQGDTTQLDDPLLLEEIFISDISLTKSLSNGQSITSISDPSNSAKYGVASTLNNIPGIFVDGSTGEVFSRLSIRGIALNAEDDIGWYYTSLQEDGLPVTAIQYNQFAPDFFVRPDLSNRKVEIVKGGKSSIIAPSSPAGIVNYISQTNQNNLYHHHRATFGLHHGGRSYQRLEGIGSFRLGASSWWLDAAYMYRHDRGPRNVDYALNDGGQAKLALRKVLPKGVLSFQLKYLNDHVNRYTGVPATNWDNPVAAFGTDFRTSTLLVPGLDGQIPDSRDQFNSNYNFNPSNGIGVTNIEARISLDQEIASWRLKNLMKYSRKGINWQTTIGGQPLGLDNFLTYFISGAAFPIGNVSFVDVRSGSELANVNNEGAFATFQGADPFFEYNSGTLPNDAIMASGAWYKDDVINEWMNQLTIERSFDNTDLSFGVFTAISDVDVFTNASFLYSYYEPQSRLLAVTLEGLDGQTLNLSNAEGLSNYGALFLEEADFQSRRVDLFGNVSSEVISNLIVDAGLRYQRINHSGSVGVPGPAIVPEGGLDNNPLTVFDQSILIAEERQAIDFTYGNLSASLGLIYSLSNTASIYTRFSHGVKSPELNYYLNSSNELTSEVPPSERIQQLEFGVKVRGTSNHLVGSVFNSRLSNVANSNFVFDQDANRIFYTPVQLNSSRTLGVELEWTHFLSDRFKLESAITLQDPKLTDFNLYDAKETIETGDDVIINFDDNNLPHVPKFMGSLNLAYSYQQLSVELGAQYTGARYGNLSNAFELPAYTQFGTSADYSINDQMNIGIRINNLFNSTGLSNFFGPNTFGANAELATSDFIQSNPESSFVVFPIHPRVFFLTFDYQIFK